MKNNLTNTVEELCNLARANEILFASLERINRKELRDLQRRLKDTSKLAHKLHLDIQARNA